MTMSAPKIYSRYNRPAAAGLVFSEPSHTQQQYAQECDINQIVARAMRGGDVTVFSNAERGEYYDTTTAGDFTYAMQLMTEVRSDFESLPSNIRANFANDLETYVRFMSDPRNAQAQFDLGLIEAAEKVQSPI
ncbi:MAG: hypothetical protein ACRDAP_07530, partial [Shewanella sp.]